MFLSMFLIGCGQTTTEMTTTIDTFINTEITVPVISFEEEEVFWTAVEGVSLYEVRVKDVTTTNNELLLEDDYYQISDTSFFITDLETNRLYEITVRSVIGEEHSEWSNALTFDKFVDSELTWSYSFNRNSTDDLVLFENLMPELYFIEEDGNRVSSENYYFEYDLLFIDNQYLQGLTSTIFSLYTDYGIISLEVTYHSSSRPSILSNNTIDFENRDMLFVFDLCGGEIVEVSNADISASDYDVTGNILIINADFIQGLFDANPERETVIISYQLTATDEIVIGYIFINRVYDLE